MVNNYTFWLHFGIQKHQNIKRTILAPPDLHPPLTYYSSTSRSSTSTVRTTVEPPLLGTPVPGHKIFYQLLGLDIGPIRGWNWQ